MKIKLTSVMVEDQAKALVFYSDVMGFKKKADLPFGPARWLTVTSSEPPREVELLLEPMTFPPAKVYQQALFAAGIPATAFETDHIQADFERMQKQGVVFRQPPTAAGPVTLAVFEDTCGNLIQLYQL